MVILESRNRLVNRHHLWLSISKLLGWLVDPSTTIVWIAVLLTRIQICEGQMSWAIPSCCHTSCIHSTCHHRHGSWRVQSCVMMMNTAHVILSPCISTHLFDLVMTRLVCIVVLWDLLKVVSCLLLFLGLCGGCVSFVLPWTWHLLLTLSLILHWVHH